MTAAIGERHSEILELAGWVARTVDPLRNTEADRLEPRHVALPGGDLVVDRVSQAVPSEHQATREVRGLRIDAA